MHLSHIALFLAPVLLAQAQSSDRDRDEPSVTLITSLSTGVVVNGNREMSTFTSTIVITSTIEPETTPGPGNGDNNNSSRSGSSGSGSSDRASSTRPLPTASDVPGGGGPNGAPEVGKSNARGIYGPPDDHFSSALRPVACLFALGGVLAGSISVLL